MRGTVGLAVLLLVAPLAGCIGSETTSEAPVAPSSDQDDPGAKAASDVLTAPNWTVSDHWTFQTSDGREDTWVVTGDRGRDWIVDTTSRETAFFDARSDISFLGKVRKDDLSGSQGDTRVEFFDWPLEEGKSWTTSWDGVQREITVDRIEDGIGHLTATQNGRPAVEYTYDSQAGHFGGFTFLDANGSETFSAELTNSGADFTGTPLRWQLTPVIDRNATFGLQPVSWGGMFEVPANATDLWLQETIVCPSGAYSFGFGGNQSGYQDNTPCPQDTDVRGFTIENPEAGSWSYGFTATSPQGEGNYTLKLFIRTLVEVPVGPSTT